MVSPVACCRLPGLCARAVAARLMRLRIVYKLLLLVCVGLWVVLPLWQLLDAAASRQRRACYAAAAGDARDSLAAAVADRQSGTQRLPDVLLAMRQPTPDRTIFFIDASCRSGGSGAVVQLNSRQACSIESAARAHPDWDVFVLFASPARLARNTTTTNADGSTAFGTHAARLQHHYPNVYYRNVDLWRYARDTPIADWMAADEGNLFASASSASADLEVELRDYVRFVTLHRYGGTVIDLDVIVRRPLDELGANWAALDGGRDGNVRAGCMNLNRTQADGGGGRMAEYALHEFKHRFRGGATWSNMGLDALNRVVRTVCAAGTTGTGSDAERLQAGECSGEAGRHFRVLPAAAFYAVPQREWTALLNDRQAYYVSELTRDAFAVKLWSEWSGRTPVRRVRRAQEPVPLLYLAETHCPRVWEASGRWF